jgi:hypothetical protein
MKKRYITAFVAFSILAAGCTKLDEKLNGQVENADVTSGNVGSLLSGAYTSMRSPYQGTYGWWALQEFPSDEAIAPTRAGDWDDNGAWRALHLHRWDADHPRITSVFRDLNSVTYATTNLLQFNPSTTQEAEARFLRAMAQFSVLDGWGQVPYRDPGEEVTVAARVRPAGEAWDYIVAELNAILPNLPEGPNYIANKDAARVLLMKCYLNKGAFLNRQTPTFDAADMNQVITLADQIINTGKYTLSANYFDNFAPKNDALSKENIFTAQNLGGASAGGVNSTWIAGLHYNQRPGGNNGFATLAAFYNKFEASDKRRGGPYQGVTDVSGINVGLLVGQQKDEKGTVLKDRRGNNLIFTPEVSIIERDPNHLEVAGIRVVKYPIDYANLSTGVSENDWVYFRYADVLLMKAEALLRTSQNAPALAIVNNLRVVRGASPITTLTLENLLDERGREFYWEGMRRQDLIRFGQYLTPTQEKTADDPKYLLFPIPNPQLTNTNLVQNPGY